MTYLGLRDRLNQLTDAQLACDLTVYVESMGEYFALTGFGFADPRTNDVLDENHPFFILDSNNFAI